MATTDQATVKALAAPEAVKTIGNYRVHPAARLIPKPSADDYARLKADIAQRGLRVSVVLTPDGQIIDGRTRVLACAELGIPLATRVATINEMLDPAAFVLSMNAARRHLLADQIAAIYIQANAPRVEADQNAAEEAQQAGLKKGTARGVHVAPTGKTAEKIAKATGVSESTVKRVRKVKKVAPERLADVAAGHVSAMKVLKEIAPRKSATKDPDTKQPAAKRSAKLKKGPTFKGSPYGTGRRSIEACIARVLQDVTISGEFLVKVLADAKQVGHSDFPQWIEKAVARTTQIGTILNRLQKEPCPTREEVDVLLHPDEQQDEAAGPEEGKPLEQQDTPDGTGLQPLISDAAGSAEALS